MITNLLDRQVKSNFTSAIGTIVAVFVDRGQPTFIVENPEGGLYTTMADVAQLVKETP